MRQFTMAVEILYGVWRLLMQVALIILVGGFKTIVKMKGKRFCFRCVGERAKPINGALH